MGKSFENLAGNQEKKEPNYSHYEQRHNIRELAEQDCFSVSFYEVIMGVYDKKTVRPRRHHISRIGNRGQEKKELENNAQQLRYISKIYVPG